MHELMAFTMIGLGLANLMAAIAEARRGAPRHRWVPHAAMGVAMAGMHIVNPTLLWAGGAVLAAVAFWARACRTDLASCAVLLCAWAGRQSAEGMPMAMGTRHEGNVHSSPALYAVLSLVAVLTMLAWSVTRSVLHVRRCDAPDPAPLVVRTMGMVMVPLMAAMVLWG
ncbi:hypothetical protein QF034_000060 [Streptomyces africanus]|uniref:DUF5134 domain-containing protein n=1 Tax=Streptomyces africanus TaxID=231024 RepID=A0ABU0QGY3_9ACTN|nr:hypothetical protein [Streptomyces africanus]MDQ0745829.1 hypothetical protein [Streptomyces africanus]